MLLFAVCMAGCLAPRPGEEELTAREFGEMMEEAGARPVVADVEEGQTADLEGTAHPEPDPAAVEALLEQEPEEPEYEESPYIRFGERIIVKESAGTPTMITKPYPLPKGRPQKIADLIAAMEPFPWQQRAADSTTLDPTVVEYQILVDQDEEYFTNFAEFEKSPAGTNAVAISDVLVVTATGDLLEEFEDFLDLFAGSGVPQIELEAKIIEIVETDSLDVGFRQATEAGETVPTFAFGDRNFVQSFGAELPNFADSAEALLALGAVQDGVVFSAILEAVKNWQNVSIESRPKTVVRAGGVARIETFTKVPFLNVKTLAPDGTFTTSIEYQDVGVQLWISPRKVGTSTLALDVQLEGSQQVGRLATVALSSGLVEVPVIAYRTAKTVVYLEPGQTLVIGGLTSEREQDIESRIPILGDIPLLGFFFRSTFTSIETQHVLFAISPRIIQRSDFDADL